MKRAVVTGANGFLGSHLCKALCSAGAEVYSLVQEGMNTGHVAGTVVPFDLAYPQKSLDVLPQSVDAFYHFAWVGVSTTHKNEFGLQIGNVQASLECLKLAQNIGAKRIVFPGSISEYAYAEKPVNGEISPSPCDMYSACKVSTHMICDVYAKQNSLCFIWALLPSIYGPGREDNNLVTYTIKTLLKGQRPSFTKLEQLWDYLYLEDAISALALLGEKGELGTYPIGSGEHRPLAEYVHMIRDAVDPALPLGIGELPYKTSRIDNSLADITRMQKDTGFIPVHSFKEGIKKTVSYFREQQQGEK